VLDRANLASFFLHGESFGDKGARPPVTLRKPSQLRFLLGNGDPTPALHGDLRRLTEPNLSRASGNNHAFTMRTNLPFAFGEQSRSQTRLYLYRLVIVRGEAATNTEFSIPA
jgi:hypothetical protein